MLLQQHAHAFYSCTYFFFVVESVFLASDEEEEEDLLPAVPEPEAAAFFSLPEAPDALVVFALTRGAGPARASDSSFPGRMLVAVESL